MQNKNILTGLFTQLCHCERSVAIAELSRNQEPPSGHHAPDAGSVKSSEKRFRLRGRNDGMTCHCERPAGASQSHYRQVKAAFTLAEVLITLGVIGVVAAVTLPTVVNNMQARIRSEQVRTAKYKFTLATDKMNSLGLIGPYDSTEAFVKELQKHLKLAKVCPPGKLEGCWPTKEVKLNNDGKMFEISKVVTGKQLKMKTNETSDYTSDNVGIVTADGVPMIISYNKKCEPLDPVKQYAWTTEDNKPVSNATAGCVAAVMDINGSKKPNKLSEDIVLFNARGLGEGCGMEIAGKCFSAPIASSLSLTPDVCEAEKDKLGIKECVHLSSSYTDYWAGAVKTCGGVDKMATMEDLGTIATAIYGVNFGAMQNIYSGLTYNTAKSGMLGLPSPTFRIWSGQETPPYGAHFRAFYSDGSWINDYSNYRFSSHLAVCKIDS